MVWEPASHRGCWTKELFFMGSKGNGKHFVGLRFAWHGLESCCCSGVSEPASKGLAPMVSELRPQLGCRTKALVFIGSKGEGKHFVGPGFAWHGLSILSDLRLQGSCANGLGTSLAPRVPDKRTVFYGFQRWREAFCRAAFCLAWARILLLFGCFGTGLQRTCANGFGTTSAGFGTSLAPRVPDKRTVFYGFQRWREVFCRAGFCLAWARILLKALSTFLLGSVVPKVVGSILSGCVLLGMGSQRQAFSQGHLPRWCRSDEGSGWCRSDRRFPKAICRDDVGATSDLAISGQRDCFLWIPKVTWSSFSVCVFSWRGLESCCCWTPSYIPIMYVMCLSICAWIAIGQKKLFYSISARPWHTPGVGGMGGSP